MTAVYYIYTSDLEFIYFHNAIGDIPFLLPDKVESMDPIYWGLLLGYILNLFLVINIPHGQGIPGNLWPEVTIEHKD